MNVMTGLRNLINFADVQTPLINQKGLELSYIEPACQAPSSLPAGGRAVGS